MINQHIHYTNQSQTYKLQFFIVICDVTVYASSTLFVFQPISENSRELESLEGLDGYAYLPALAGQIGRANGTKML